MNQLSGCRGGDNCWIREGQVLVLWVPFAVISSSQALIKACVVVFCLFRFVLFPARLVKGLGCRLVRFLCSNLFIWGIFYYTHREVFGSLRVYLIYEFCIGLILFIVLWYIAYAVFITLLVCKESPCYGGEPQYVSQVRLKYYELTPTPDRSGLVPSFIPFNIVYSTPRLSLTMT